MYIIKVNGDIEVMIDTSFKAIQKAVGGYVQTIPTNDGKLMALDEEGKLKLKPINKKAGKLVTKVGLNQFDVVVGDVVILERSELENASR